MSEVLEFSEVRTLAFKNGGCFGDGISYPLSFSISTTSDIDGLNASEACVQRSPICSKSDACFARKLPFKSGSTVSVILFPL